MLGDPFGVRSTRWLSPLPRGPASSWAARGVTVAAPAVRDGRSQRVSGHCSRLTRDGHVGSPRAGRHEKVRRRPVAQPATARVVCTLVTCAEAALYAAGDLDRYTKPERRAAGFSSIRLAVPSGGLGHAQPGWVGFHGGTAAGFVGPDPGVAGARHRPIRPVRGLAEIDPEVVQPILKSVTRYPHRFGIGSRPGTVGRRHHRRSTVAVRSVDRLTHGRR